MKLKYLLIFLIFNIQALLAQNGDLPLTHYEIPIPSQDLKFNDLKIDNQGRLILAYDKGLLQYDGNSWLKIEINSSPLKFLDINETPFLIAKDGIYTFKEDAFHQNTLHKKVSLSINSSFTDLVYHQNKFYLLIDEEIIVYDEEFNKVDVFRSNLGYKDIFTFDDKLFAFEDNYLLENVEGTWVDLNLYAPENTDFLFSIKGNDILYFAYDNGEFYSFNGKKFETFSEEINQYLSDNFAISGKFYEDKLIISTLSGGVLLIDENSKNISSTIQKYNGLPTNEVSAVTMDLQNGLWLAHPFGLSRASLNIPLSDFQYYPGLEGLPETSILHNGKLWVGTTRGLFYLKEVKDYETLTKKYIEKVKISSDQKPEDEGDENFFEELFSVENNNAEVEIYIEKELNKFKEIYKEKGIRFLALRRKLNEKEEQLRDSIRKANKGKPKANPEYKTVIKTTNISKLKSIDYEYEKISEIDDHIETLIPFKNSLIAKSNTGIYLIKDFKANKISSLKMINKLYFEVNKNRLWIANDQGLFSLSIKDDNYKVIKHSDHIFNDMLIIRNQLIAVGSNQIEIFDIVENDITSKKKIEISNNFSEELAVFNSGQQIKLLRSDAILDLNLKSFKLKIDSTFENPLKYFLKDQKENMWIISSDNQWTVLNKNIQEQARKWFRILPSIKNINFINDEKIFFISNNRIIEWLSTPLQNYTTPKSFIDGIKIENKWIEDLDKIKLKHNENNLQVLLSTPEYLFTDDIEYQYYVKGLMDEWSGWSKNKEIDFPYIPTGNYKLQIKARTILSNEINNFSLDFKVTPPYWQTWWFYLLEIAFFSILIFISIKLNTTNQSSFLTKTFTFLTLILFLEFIATILENNLEGYVDDSPVYTFIINVILAVSISPIERGISKILVIWNSARSKSLISQMRKNQQKKENEQNQD
ncbi:triple tyrosine motif-containing protein [Marivirga arenosa]|uniref:Triple tyrosine motif-containing protein n=1 Tax=Marivirga arenosa TaxID=3059076 RepID=A0AA51N4L0_9BACT|nr:triple tyrosine motif-containing protein [Marivirga sp. ABR2-2]WMN06162.1 triple tyrosine motif-containing protein [Marivirga sp. ABR2-2]